MNEKFCPLKKNFEQFCPLKKNNAVEYNLQFID